MCKSSVRSSPVIPYPTITPESPLKVPTLTSSVFNVGGSIKIVGAVSGSYPDPPSVIIIASTTPSGEIVEVAYALWVVPSPTGFEILTSGAVTYPNPPSDIVIAFIVPATETVASTTAISTLS
tara:strand:- start:319 stop:687 length:369 start_codon:yes stop_codon:yes gene_type:complete